MVKSNPHGGRVYVWDLPLRLFHWSLPLLLAVSWISVELQAMKVHELSGYAMLTLLLFRLVWGVIGSRTARFAYFVRGVPHTLEYARALRSKAAVKHIGHNPLGGWMVVLLLTVLLLQALTGLFSHDVSGTAGPLAGWVSYDASDWLTQFHSWNFDVLLGLVGIHLAAIAYYARVRGDNLVKPMLTGYKDVPHAHEPLHVAPLWQAALLLAAAAAGVYALVSFA